MRLLLTAALLVGFAAPVAAQEKEYVLDTRTGKVSQKDADQDKEIAVLKAEVAALKAKLTPAAPEVATRDPFAVAAEADCKCGPACPCSFTPGTTAPGVGTPLPAPGLSSGPVQSGGLTYTVVPAGSGGITSGCASGNFAAPSFRPVRRLFGR
jgi:hypothetical protein